MLWVLYGSLLLGMSIRPAEASQGCAQCKDNVSALPAETRNAYRDAILLLVGAGVAVFAATVLMLRRER